ncbi:dihydrofolate reductase family protein [Streptomyces sp. A7024]|uniref:Dihydrofolate reductase family protein n=2 Tax=Streptomyces coryli TaxID=1128680 RepID=A0A6G4TT13_9ACTN|nr:dihydrofolate reductase family protein [Streptomyces coryli]
METPSWVGRYFDAEHAAYAHQQLLASEALLLGRTTYEIFASSWPGLEDTEGDFAVRMNAMPKYVVSATLSSAEWKNTTVLGGGDPAAAVAEVRRRHAGDVLVYGSGRLADALLGAGLVDELKLWVHPVVVGAGRRLFRDGGTPSQWRLEEAVPFGSGGVVLDYRPQTPGTRGGGDPG